MSTADDPRQAAAGLEQTRPAAPPQTCELPDFAGRPDPLGRQGIAYESPGLPIDEATMDEWISSVRLPEPDTR